MISVMRIRLPFSNPLLKLITGISLRHIGQGIHQHFTEMATGDSNQYGVCILNRDFQRARGGELRV
jgi:hypothetical protein